MPGLQLKGGLLSTDENNRLPYVRDLNNWQTRAGIAYQFRADPTLPSKRPTYPPVKPGAYNHPRRRKAALPIRTAA